MCSVNKEMEESDVTCSVNKQMRHGTLTVENWFNDHLRKVLGFLPILMILFSDRYLFYYLWYLIHSSDKKATEILGTGGGPGMCSTEHTKF